MRSLPVPQFPSVLLLLPHFATLSRHRHDIAVASAVLSIAGYHSARGGVSFLPRPRPRFTHPIVPSALATAPPAASATHSTARALAARRWPLLRPAAASMPRSISVNARANSGPCSVAVFGLPARSTHPSGGGGGGRRRERGPGGFAGLLSR